MSLIFNWLDLVNYPSLSPPASGGPSSIPSRYRNQHHVILKNGALYVFTPEDAGFSSTNRIYSSPTGVSWSILDTTCPQSIYSYLILKGETPPNPSGTLLELLSSSGSNSVLHYSDFNGAGWDGQFTIDQGGPATHQHVPFRAAVPYISESALLLFTRSDGTQIMIKQGDYDGGALSGFARIEIWKQDLSATWAILTTLGTGTLIHHTLMAGGIHPTSSDVHFFLTQYDEIGSPDLFHISVSAADAISGFNAVEAAIEPAATTPSVNYQRCDFSADGNTLLYAYGYNTDSGYVNPASTPTGEVHAAICDLSVTPLTPTITVETVATNTANWDVGNTVSIGASFRGGNTPNVYWLNWQNVGSTPYADGILLHSQRTAPATWATPDALFGAVDYPSQFTDPTAASVMAFDLLNAFTNGVGILIEVYDQLSGLNYLGYSGPVAGGRRTFASQPMHAQQLAGHSRTSRIP